MISKKYKGRCEKITLSKCKTVCRTYNSVQLAYAKALDDNDMIVSFQCNVLLEGFPEGSYTTDFLCVKTDGDLMVRECVLRHLISKPKTARLLQASQEYWHRRGVEDWGIVVDAKE